MPSGPSCSSSSSSSSTPVLSAVSSSFSSSSSPSFLEEDYSSLPPFSSARLCVPYERAIPPSQSPSALLRVASVLIRFDPSRRLTLKQTLFMTHGIIAKRARYDDPRYSAPTSCSHRDPAGFALSLYGRRQTRRDERAPKEEGGRESKEEETPVLYGRTWE